MIMQTWPLYLAIAFVPASFETLLRRLYPTGFFVGAGAALLATVKKG